MAFAVSRDGTALVTLHGGSDTTACDDAETEFAATLERLETEDAITEWAVTDAEVYEQPTAPFEPYTVAVSFTVTVTVDADDAETASERGASEIESVLERADVEGVTYTAAATASPV